MKAYLLGLFIALAVVACGGSRSQESTLLADWYGESTKTVTGKLEHCCASYFTTTTAKTKVEYKNRHLPWGTIVYLRHSYRKTDLPESRGTYVDWPDVVVVPMGATEPYVWSVALEKQIYTRGQSTRLDHFQFVFEIHFANGDVMFDKGGASSFGFYQAKFPDVTTNCGAGGAFCTLEVTSVEKNN